MPENGWIGYEKLVLQKLDDLQSEVKAIDARITHLYEQDITSLKVEIAMLKVKSGLWGAAAGLVPASIVALYVLTKVPG